MARAEPPRRSDLPSAAWRTETLIRFAHCDPAGIVFFARYFEIVNAVYEDWMPPALGLDHTVFIRDRRTGLGPAHASCDFFAPGRLGDRLTFAVLVERVGGSSFALAIPAFRGEEPILVARQVIVTTSLDRGGSVPLPDDLRRALEAYRERCR